MHHMYICTTVTEPTASKQWRNRKTWTPTSHCLTHPFFTHHRTFEGRSIGPFMVALPCQYLYYQQTGITKSDFSIQTCKTRSKVYLPIYRATRCQEALIRNGPHPDVAIPLTSNNSCFSFNIQLSHCSHWSLGSFTAHSPANSVLTTTSWCMYVIKCHCWWSAITRILITFDMNWQLISPTIN